MHYTDYDQSGYLLNPKTANSAKKSSRAKSGKKENNNLKRSLVSFHFSQSAHGNRAKTKSSKNLFVQNALFAQSMKVIQPVVNEKCK